MNTNFIRENIFKEITYTLRFKTLNIFSFQTLFSSKNDRLAYYFVKICYNVMS